MADQDDDDDDDQDAPAPKKSGKSKGDTRQEWRRGDKRGGGKKSDGGGIGAAAAGTAAAAAFATAVRGDSLFTDLLQGVTPLAVRETADLIARLLPESVVALMRPLVTEFGAVGRGLIKVAILGALDQLNLMPEGTNQTFNDFIIDLVSAVERRAKGQVLDERVHAEARTTLERLNKTKFVWLPEGVLTSDDPVMHADDCLALPLNLVERRKRYHRVGIVRARLLIQGADKPVERRSCCAAKLNHDFAEVDKEEKKLMDKQGDVQQAQEKNALELLSTPEGVVVLEFVTTAYDGGTMVNQGGVMVYVPGPRDNIMTFLQAHLNYEYELKALYGALVHAEEVANARGLDLNARTAEAKQLFEIALQGIKNAKTAKEEVVDVGKKALEAVKERADLTVEIGSARTWLEGRGVAIERGLAPVRAALLAPPPPPKPMKERGWFERVCVWLHLLSDDTQTPTAQPNQQQQGGQQPPQGGTP